MREAQTRSYPEEPSGSSSLIKVFPAAEEIERQLRRLSEMNDPVSQVAYLEKLEAELRHAHLFGRRGKISGSRLFMLRRLVRCEKEKAQAWMEQHLARKAQGQVKLKGRAFTAPTGSEDFRNHLRELRHCNETLRELAQDHWTVSHNRALGTTGYDHERVEEWLAGIESNLEGRQEQIINLIQARIDELESLKDRKEYLRQVLLWYEEADYIGRYHLGRHRYGELRPFTEVVEGIRKLAADLQPDASATNLRRGASSERGHRWATEIGTALERNYKKHGYYYFQPDRPKPEKVFHGSKMTFKEWAAEMISDDVGPSTVYKELLAVECYVKDNSGSSAGLRPTVANLIRYVRKHRRNQELN